MNGHTDLQDLADTLASHEAEDLQAVKEVRKLVIDICRQNGGGHGGSAIGMAPMAVALWKYAMRYNPMNPEWFDRDRFVLSNGHAAMLQYAMLHVSGYPHMTVDELKLYGSAKAVDKTTGKWKATICHAHPEIDVPGVEVTTGPLGQGIANAVGLAIASRNLAATFNKPDYDIIGSHIYCITGDGCLQEGVANEAGAIAGHLGLDNLTLLYDNNQVTCDGPLDWIVSEDTNAKMRAMGWNTIDVLDGDSSVASIAMALAQAKAYKGKPTLINIRTTIGHGTSTAGTFKSHHGTYTDEDAAKQATSGVAATHTLSEETRKYWSQVVSRGEALENGWKGKMKEYSARYPEEAVALRQRLEGNIDAEKILGSLRVPEEILATRQFNGVVFNELMARIPNMVAGGADLWNSNQMGDQSSRVFDRNHPEGRVIRYGIREHAMASISNGIAAYAPGCFLPVTATFFMFYLYAAAGVRMGALSDLKVIHVATHDSIGEGQNGPTHQPVELDSLFRAMPKLQYIRPADSEEVIGAWLTALGVEHAPSIISLARDPALSVIPNTDRHKVRQGGYVIVEKEGAVVTLVSCGSELQFAVEAAKELNVTGVPTRVVSMPCIRLFEEQPPEYQDSVLSHSMHIISVEAYVSSMWARFCTASVAMDSFGYSGAGRENFGRFGIDTDGVVKKVRAHVHEVELDSGARPRRWKLLK
ncbi:Transketolase, C-terminal/Pyruvate-ferredoxin oxidoreductase, domain II [Pleurostoma richardsiae]|uniref:Transketolase, C-terminal/Pyruvate-ferredoxin oxidoreductase, domain II n=1 Tax=Pleurostoma richardsiae TaxID=41990 RepID=A0AA38RPY0_9PEZI|nr:Transketolase, C-terminal/Pyruvate-ferredoxin oxidoreductase, domain II [Pleurostoma richardsiae]